MAPAEVCDVMDFWASVTYPVSEAEVFRLARERCGWTTRTEDGEEFLVNSAAGLTIPEIGTASLRGGEVFMSLSFWVTDVIREVSEESSAFLGDRFALLVREGTSRWGKPKLVKTSRGQRAQWTMRAAGEVSFNLSAKSVTAAFSTPQAVEIDRKAGF